MSDTLSDAPSDSPSGASAALLDPATHRLVRAVDAMTDAQWAEPSLLPSWTRAHVVAHLTLNAEALAAALDGVHEGADVAMYASQEARDADIAALGALPPSEVRDRFLASTTRIADRIAVLAENLADVTFPRVPGSAAVVRAGDVAAMRVREVEIHHADLDLGYTALDWPADFVPLLLDARVALWRDESRFTAHAVDLDRRWGFGPEPGEGPTVSGRGVDLAWWTTGRGSGEGLTSDSGELPRIGAW